MSLYVLFIKKVFSLTIKKIKLNTKLKYGIAVKINQNSQYA